MNKNKIVLLISGCLSAASLWVIVQYIINSAAFLLAAIKSPFGIIGGSNTGTGLYVFWNIIRNDPVPLAAFVIFIASVVMFTVSLAKTLSSKNKTE